MSRSPRFFPPRLRFPHIDAPRGGAAGLAVLAALTTVSAIPVRGRSGADARYAVAHPVVSVARLDAPIRRGPQAHQPIVGWVRRGSAVKLGARGRGAGCKKGRWYRVAEGGYLCTAEGFRVTTRPRRYRARQRPPDRRRSLPYDYVRVTTGGAPLLTSVPGARDARRIQRAMAGRGRWPGPVHHAMVGDYFLALQGEVRRGKRRYHRTVQGYYARRGDLKRLSGSALRGTRLTKRASLPLVFVHRPGVRRYRWDGRRMKRAGLWSRYARFSLHRRVRHGGHSYLVAATGYAIRDTVARVARRRRRPPKVGARQRWIHVDLGTQTLVAYRGDRPVYATLVSTGKRGHTTPAGLHRIHAKHVSTTMSGTDPRSGRFRVEEVPWTLFYDGSYALHGAYWHDDFGRVRSHGCTNLAPADARWLFLWTTPRVPSTWHARLGVRGTWVHLTPARLKK